jgi:hypothetical protein
MLSYFTQHLLVAFVALAFQHSMNTGSMNMMYEYLTDNGMMMDVNLESGWIDYGISGRLLDCFVVLLVVVLAHSTYMLIQLNRSGKCWMRTLAVSFGNYNGGAGMLVFPYCRRRRLQSTTKLDTVDPGMICMMMMTILPSEWIFIQVHDNGPNGD